MAGANKRPHHIVLTKKEISMIIDLSPPLLHLKGAGGALALIVLSNYFLGVLFF